MTFVLDDQTESKDLSDELEKLTHIDGDVYVDFEKNLVYIFKDNKFEETKAMKVFKVFAAPEQDIS